MSEDEPPPEEKPRYLLPEGCKDIIDAIRLQQESAAPEQPVEQSAASVEQPPEPPPSSVTLPDPVRVAELASALHMKPHVVIGSLMHFNVFASLHTEIEFSTARELCSMYGVAAHQVI